MEELNVMIQLLKKEIIYMKKIIIVVNILNYYY